MCFAAPVELHRQTGWIGNVVGILSRQSFDSSNLSLRQQHTVDIEALIHDRGLLGVKPSSADREN